MLGDVKHLLGSTTKQLDMPSVRQEEFTPEAARNYVPQATKSNTSGSNIQVTGTALILMNTKIVFC